MTDSSLNQKKIYTFICEKCGKEFEQELKLRDFLKGNYKRFCSRQCANSHPWIKDKNKEFKCVDCGKIIFKSYRSNPLKVRCDSCKQLHEKHLHNIVTFCKHNKCKETNIDICKYCKYNKRKCIICGKEFYPKLMKKGFSVANTCSAECLHKLKSEKSKTSYLKLVDEGRFKGWQKRNKISYAEQFWINVLNTNNISFVHEYKFDKYFLDFYIEKNLFKTINNI